MLRLFLLLSLPLSLWNTTTIRISSLQQYNSILHRSAARAVECWLYVLSLPTELRVQDAFSYEWLLCACASCMLMTSVIRATLVDSVCLCVCKQNALGKVFILRFSHVRPLFIPMIQQCKPAACAQACISMILRNLQNNPKNKSLVQATYHAYK